MILCSPEDDNRLVTGDLCVSAFKSTIFVYRKIIPAQ